MPSQSDFELWQKQTRFERTLTVTLVVGALAWHAGDPAPVHLRAEAPPAALSETQAACARLPLNDADGSALETVKYIGPKLAQRILDRRRKLKGFRRWAQVLRVRGIGKRTLGKLKAATCLRCTPCERPKRAAEPPDNSKPADS